MTRMFSSLKHSPDLLKQANNVLLIIFHTGHGGSDGLHGYVPSLDNVAADTVSLIIAIFF